MNVATPPVSVPVPISTPPSRKLTVPAGTPAPGATVVTVAVNVTDCPKVEGLSDDPRAVVVAAWLTVCVTAGEVLPVKLAFPAYTAVMERAPTASAEVDSVAWPPLSGRRSPAPSCRRGTARSPPASPRRAPRP